MKLDIWDTAGQERFRSLAPHYYRNADLVLVVYDITCATSFSAATETFWWYQELLRIVPDCLVVLVGNKVDMEEQREVDKMEVDHVAATRGWPHIEVSAKDGTNIAELFHKVATMLDHKFPLAA